MCVSTWEVFLQLIAFNLGSLGFLTNHFYENYIRDLKGVIYGREDLEQCCLDLEDGLAVRFIKRDSQMGNTHFMSLSGQKTSVRRRRRMSCLSCIRHCRSNQVVRVLSLRLEVLSFRFCHLLKDICRPGSSYHAQDAATLPDYSGGKRIP